MLREAQTENNLLSNIAEVLSGQPDLPGAKRMYEEALATQEIGYKSGAAFSLTNLGDVLSKQGDLPGAQKKLEEALAIQNEIGEKGHRIVVHDQMQIQTRRGFAIDLLEKLQPLLIRCFPASIDTIFPSR